MLSETIQRKGKHIWVVNDSQANIRWIKKQISTQEIEIIAIAEGMITMKAYGVKLIEQQLTTVAELSKVCR